MTGKNIPASIHDRLANEARKINRPFQELLEHFAMERFLYRLSISEHSDYFILKGALLLRVWDTPAARPTRDIDFLGHTSNSPGNITRMIREICDLVPEQDDGLICLTKSIKSEKIREDADYEGVRVRFEVLLGRAKIPMQIDVGFGDVIVPGAQAVVYPTILKFPAPNLKGYSRESVIAEKLEAMVKLGAINGRMKDFYDIWFMARHFDFDGLTLSKAVNSTFGHRGTKIESFPIALTPEFVASAEVQWKAFLRRMKFNKILEFKEVVLVITEFSFPFFDSLNSDSSLKMKWKAPGPWRR